jgi:hypothetical protein
MKRQPAAVKSPRIAVKNQLPLLSRQIGMWRLALYLRNYRHDFRLGGVLRDNVMRLRRFALGFRFQERSPFITLLVKNLREEVLIAVAMENQSRLRLSLAPGIIDVEVGHLFVVLVHAADHQNVGGTAGWEPADRIFAGFELFITNLEIEWNGRPDPAAEACKPDDGHRNQKGQCGDNAKYLLFQNYLRLSGCFFAPLIFSLYDASWHPSPKSTR